MNFDWDWRLFLGYIDVLAWPMLIGFAILMFKKPITDRIRSIKNLKYKGGEVHFDQFQQVVAGYGEMVTAGVTMTATGTVTTEAEVTTDQGELAMYIEDPAAVVEVAVKMRTGRPIRVFIGRSLDGDARDTVLSQMLMMSVATGYGFDFSPKSRSIVLMKPGESII